MSKIPVKLLSGFDEALAGKFAPVIADNQEVTCYVDEEMTPYAVQGDNIIIIPENQSGSENASYSVVHEIHTLTADEATDESFTLGNSIASGQENNISLSVCGVSQILDTDFSVVSNSITWSDKALHNVGLVAGDVFVIDYLTD